MERLKSCINWLKQWQYLGIAVIVIASLLLHLGLMIRPDEPLFDEVHYVNDARHAIGTGGTERTEHPPLGKLLVVGGMLIFGDNPVGWRLIAILMGAASLVFFYMICRRLNLSEKVCYLAVFLLAFENLTFVQSQIAMLDVYCQFFILLSLWMYLRGSYPLSAISIALAALAKLNGVLVVLVIGMHWLLARCPNWKKFIASYITLAPLAFLVFLPVLEYTYFGELQNPISRALEMVKLTGSITFDAYEAGSIASRPWEWVLTPENFVYWWNPRFIGMLSPTLWILIIPSIVYVTYRALKGDDAPLFPFSMFIGLYLVWIPASLISNRASFIFYFYPAIPSVAIALGIVFGKLIDVSRERLKGKLRLLLKIIIPLYLLGHLIAFNIMAPPSLWWKIPFSIGMFIFSFWYLRLGPTPYPEPARLVEEGDEEVLLGMNSSVEPDFQAS
ncbi:MAG: phospholipid carrier-dependent glycosyltransferase [Dehalococcoidales bacterium]